VNKETKNVNTIKDNKEILVDVIHV